MKIKNLNQPLLISIVLYLLGVLLVNPLGNFPINDDWLFQRQIEAFSKGIFKMNVLIDPTFIFQAVLGRLWSLFFGYGFVSLRIFTIILTLLFFIGISLILDLIKTNRKTKLVVLLCLAFNPLIFTSSLTFMTEIYFLVTTVFSFYFFLKFFESKNLYHLLLGSIFCAFSFLVRQVGLVTFIAFLISNLLFRFRDKNFCRNLITSLLPLLVGFVILKYWPSYGVGKAIIFESKFLSVKILQVFFSVPLIAFFVGPVILMYLKKLSRLSVLTALPIALLIFKHDVFPLGNVFYLESLYSKVSFRNDLSLFNNVIFKSLVSLYVGILIVALFWILFDVIKKRPRNVFLFLVSLGYLVSAFLGTDTYDRYLLPFVVSFVVLIVSLNLEEEPMHFRTILFCLVFMAFVTLFLNYEFMTVRRLKWDQVKNIQERFAIGEEIFLDGVYTKYVYASDTNNYSGFGSAVPGGLQRMCYIQDYAIEGKNLFVGVEDFLGKYIENPGIYDGRKVTDVGKIKKHIDELIYNKEYFSPLYSIIGKKAFVGAWCDKDFIESVYKK